PTEIHLPERGPVPSLLCPGGKEAADEVCHQARLRSYPPRLEAAEKMKKDGTYLGAGQVTRPGVVVRMLYRTPPAVMYSVFKSSPPKAQLVTSSVGTGKKSSSFPCGLKT